MALTNFSSANIIELPTDPLGTNNDTFTLMAWVNTTVGQWCVLTRYIPSSATYTRFMVYTGKPCFNETGNATINYANTVITNTGWRHICIVRGSGTVNFYLDGVGDGSASRSNPTYTTTRFGVGNLWASVAQQFQGTIFDARAYSVSLSATTVAQIAGAYGRDGIMENCVLRMGIADGCVGLGSLSGKKVYDHSSNHTAVAVTGAPTAAADPYEPYLMEDA